MHPAVVLHFSNAAPATSPQAHNVHSGAAQTFQFAVPQATYSNVYLFMTSSEGAAPLTITMTYSDATTSMTNFNLPDYGTGAPLPTTPPIFFNLISGMHKWTAANAQVDTPGHTITGVTLTPTAGKQLTGIQVAKAMGGQYLVFWGATGNATSPVSLDAGTPAGDAGGSADATVADASGDDGGGAASGASSGASSGAGTGATSGSSMSGTSSGFVGASGAAGTGASTGSMAGGSGASSGSAGGSSGTGFGAGTTSGGCACSFSPAPRSGLTIVGSLAALCGVLRRRRRSV
jgi:hypothetical protein